LLAQDGSLSNHFKHSFIDSDENKQINFAFMKSTILNNQILKYLRNFPIDSGKTKISRLVDLSDYQSPLVYNAGGNITLLLD
jgi:hypothetical protein